MVFVFVIIFFIFWEVLIIYYYFVWWWGDFRIGCNMLILEYNFNYVLLCDMVCYMLELLKLESKYLDLVLIVNWGGFWFWIECLR